VKTNPRRKKDLEGECDNATDDISEYSEESFQQDYPSDSDEDNVQVRTSKRRTFKSASFLLRKFYPKEGSKIEEEKPVAEEKPVTENENAKGKHQVHNNKEDHRLEKKDPESEKKESQPAQTGQEKPAAEPADESKGPRNATDSSSSDEDDEDRSSNADSESCSSETPDETSNTKVDEKDERDSPKKKEKRTKAKGKGKETGKPKESETLQRTYREALAPLQFLSSDILDDQAMPYHYRVTAAGDRSPPSTKMMRLVLELGPLKRSLPLTPESSIFLCVDSNRMDVMKALIVGPAGTPYSAGCFEFDVYFSPEYPNVPPNVNLHTTGSGAVRFNPNLYNCGKVCLSLLGTWSGVEGENWNQKSTLLQVLVSIQALIFVSEPYYNEPGYERSKGSPWGDTQSRQYNETIRLGTVRWAMVGALQDTKSVFHEVVRTHFLLRKREVLAQVRQWSAEAKESYSVSELDTQSKALEKELEQLT